MVTFVLLRLGIKSALFIVLYFIAEYWHNILVLIEAYTSNEQATVWLSVLKLLFW